MKRKYGGSYGRRVKRRVYRKKRRSVISKAFHCQYSKRRYGRKVRALTRTIRSVKAATQHVRLRHNNMTDWSADTAGAQIRGARWLGFSGNRDANTGLITMPGLLFSLHTVRQGAQTGDQYIGYPVFGIVKDDVTGSYKYWREYGFQKDGTTADQAWQFEDTTGSTASGVDLKRNGYCNWTRLRLQFYGKTSHPTMIQVRIIKFLKEEHCPEHYDYDNGYSPDVAQRTEEGWNNIFKPLINNVLATQMRMSGPMFKTIKSYTINIDPTQTDVNDTDVYRRVLDIFNRWNKVVNFSYPNNTKVAIADLNNAMELPDLANSYTCVPQPNNAGYHVLITSFQPQKMDSTSSTDPFNTCTTAETASMDWVLQSSWSEIRN